MTVTVAQVVSVIEVVSGDGQSGLTGDALPEPVVVRVVDSGGAPVAETTVTFEPGEGHGTASPATAVSDADGGGAGHLDARRIHRNADAHSVGCGWPKHDAHGNSSGA